MRGVLHEGPAVPYQRQAEAVCRAVETGSLPGGQYTAVLIDEGHDFENAWLKAAAKIEITGAAAPAPSAPPSSSQK